MQGRRRPSIALFLEKFRLRSDSLPGWLPVQRIGTSPLCSPTEPPTSPEDDLCASPGISKKTRVVDLRDVIVSTEGTTASGNSDRSTTEKRESEDSRSDSDSDVFNEDFTVAPIRFNNETEVKKELSRKRGNHALGVVLSALYGKMLLVMGIGFPMSEVISTYIPPSFYDGFYLYLYFGSILFMISVHVNMVRAKATKSVRTTLQKLHAMRLRRTKSRGSNDSPPMAAICDSDRNDTIEEPQSPSDSDQSPCEDSARTPFSSRRTSEQRHKDEDAQKAQFGSFYLRIGAVAFGIGSMIYSGLEFGQYFELVPETKCHNIMIALTPLVRMIFTFAQMYFIFMNSKTAVASVRLGAQFGLMHMIGTNLCVWLNVLVQETRHEILHFYNPDNHTFSINSSFAAYPFQASVAGELRLNQSADAIGNLSLLLRTRRGLRGPHSIYECRRTDIFGSLVQTSSQFLFPCTIEYSLICAAILYVMWRSIVKKRVTSASARAEIRKTLRTQRPPHHYSVDCAHAHKGLFVGIFAFVMTVISLILFFVLSSRPGYKTMATLEVNVVELVLYTLTTIVVLVGMCQVRELRFTESRNLALDNILLIVAQTGSIIYNIFTIIAGHFTLQQDGILMMVTAIASMVQLLVQTLFILDASKRCPYNADQARRKPGREIVTFLLVTNFAMWLINTLEKSRADSQTVQLKFYGVWAWSVMTQTFMPLAIFYRFHSTVCLCDIWKKAFKLKTVYR